MKTTKTLGTSRRDSRLSTLSRQVVSRPLSSLKPYLSNSRMHSEQQLSMLAKSIHEFGFVNPVLVDETLEIIAGHGRVEAAKRLGLSSVPCLTLRGLMDTQKRRLRIADNRLAEVATWDFDVLRAELDATIDLDFDSESIGYSAGELDILLDGSASDGVAPDPQDTIDAALLEGPAVSRFGDCWRLGDHRIFCGDALERVSYQILLGSERAEMIVSDPPYNVRVDGHARGKELKKFREFAMASGEMSEVQFTRFLETAMARACEICIDGAIGFWFMDWRHATEILAAGRSVYTEYKNMLVWTKPAAGMGTFYRSQHELVFVFKHGRAPHINNFGLGKTGRFRTNVLSYPGYNALAGGRDANVDDHPTVKPTALIADLMRDCSRRNGIVLDSFCGSGTVLLAAERTGRRARAIEIDPLYVDLSIRRWEKATGQEARHATGTTFAEIAEERVANALIPPSARKR